RQQQQSDESARGQKRHRRPPRMLVVPLPFVVPPSGGSPARSETRSPKGGRFQRWKPRVQSRESRPVGALAALADRQPRAKRLSNLAPLGLFGVRLSEKSIIG